MSKIDRKTQKVFGSNSSNNGVFGSGAVSGGELSNDPDDIQGLPAWEGGWNPATISGEKLPALEEIQGIEYVTTRQIAYLFQEGIPEYDPATEYHENSLVKESGTVKIYKSNIDDNQGSPLSNAVNWKMVIDLDNPTYVPPIDNYTSVVSPTINDDSSDGYSQGSSWFNTVTKDIFLCVDATIGAAIWVDTGVNLSDLGALAFQNSIPNFIGDSGAGGVSGLVPAPSPGDGASGKILKADGTWGLIDLTLFPKRVHTQNITTTSSSIEVGYTFQSGKNYRIVVESLRNSSGSSVERIELSSDNGATWLSSAGAYRAQGAYSGTTNVATSSTYAYAPLTNSGQQAGPSNPERFLSSEIKLYDPVGQGYCDMTVHTRSVDDSSGVFSQSIFAVRTVSAFSANKLRLNTNGVRMASGRIVVWEESA